MRTLGLIGYGAFGQLLAEAMQPFFRIKVCDPNLTAEDIAKANHVELVDLAQAAQCHYVILAVPVQAIGPVAREIAPHVRPGAVVLDVASVKSGPCFAMDDALPDHVHIIGTHPLFGPQSVKTATMKGLKLALCPVRGAETPRVRRMAKFLTQKLGLHVYITNARAHDRDMAMVQGLTHLVAKVLHQMKPLPEELTTLSFDHLITAMNLVSGDSDELFRAIEQENPYSQPVRERFFNLTDQLRHRLEDE